MGEDGGRRPPGFDLSNDDDLVTAQLIERARLAEDLDAVRTATYVATSEEARLTLALGPGHVDPDDVTYATRVDAFSFAMEVTRLEGRVRLDARVP